jgi:nucleotide-binding universal stress UspA family protein
LVSAGERFVEEKIKICRENGVENVSYTLKVGKPTDEIVNAAEEMDADLIVMASSRI